MKIKYSLITAVVISAILLTGPGCKKNNNSSITGNWTLASVQGNWNRKMVPFNNPDTVVSGRIYSYNNTAGVFTTIYMVSGSNNDTTRSLYTLQLNFQNNGALTVTETDTSTAQPGITGGLPNVNVFTATWNYGSANSSNTYLDLYGIAGIGLLNNLNFINGSDVYAFQLKSLSDHNLVLVLSSASSNTVPYEILSYSYTMTFTR